MAGQFYLYRAFVALAIYGILGLVLVFVYSPAFLRRTTTGDWQSDPVLVASGPRQAAVGIHKNEVREDRANSTDTNHTTTAAAEVRKTRSADIIRRIEVLEKHPFTNDSSYKASNCPKTLASLTRYSAWFKSRFKPGIKVFLDKRDASNFAALKHYSLPFGVADLNSSFFADVVGHSNFVNPQLPLSVQSSGCLRCAVVGCGGILNGSGAGVEIDSHDYVFRLNRAISLGSYGNDVGRKTTFYMFFPESEHIPDVTDKNVTFIFTMFKSYDAHYAFNMIKDVDPPPTTRREEVYRRRKPKVEPSKLKLAHPDFIRYVFSRYLEGVAWRPTTGAVVVIMALHLCDEVDIYGFGYDPRFTLHYYDKTFVEHLDTQTSLHDVDKERHLWTKLHEEGVIRLFKRDV